MFSLGLHAIPEQAGYVGETVAQTGYYVFCSGDKNTARGFNCTADGYSYQNMDGSDSVILQYFVESLTKYLRKSCATLF